MHHDVVLTRSRSEPPGVTLTRPTYLDSQAPDATVAVPTVLVEDLAPIGPLAKIRHEATLWKDTVIATALVTHPPSQLEIIAEVLS